MGKNKKYKKRIKQDPIPVNPTIKNEKFLDITDCVLNRCLASLLNIPNWIQTICGHLIFWIWYKCVNVACRIRKICLMPVHKAREGFMHVWVSITKLWASDHGITEGQYQSQELIEAYEVIDKLKSELEKANSEKAHYSTRLAEEMNKKMSANESDVENVSIKNRPMNIAQEYQGLCANEWLGAKDELDQKCQDVEDSVKLEVLFQVLMMAEQEARHLHRLLISVLTNPALLINSQGVVNNHSNWKKGRSNSGIMLPVQLSNSIGDFLRGQADHVDLEPVVQNVRNSLEKQHSQGHDKGHKGHKSAWQMCKDTKPFMTYTRQATRMAWKMTTQRPPMEFQVRGRYDGPKCQDLHWGGVDPETEPPPEVVQVQPILYHGDKLMAKGKILLVSEND